MADHLTATPLRDLLITIGDNARMNSRPLPVIETDMMTAHLLADILTAEVYAGTTDLMPNEAERAFGLVAMFDGVKIKGKR